MPSRLTPSGVIPSPVGIMAAISSGDPVGDSHHGSTWLGSPPATHAILPGLTPGTDRSADGLSRSGRTADHPIDDRFLAVGRSLGSGPMTGPWHGLSGHDGRR